MKYRYRIIWFEDNYEQLKEAHENTLMKYLDSLGFDLEIDWQQTKSAKVNFESYDLIITDLNFQAPGATDRAGIEILKQVRDNKIITDVLVYSVNADELDKAIKAYDGFLERVSITAGHDYLIEKIKSLIELTLKKVQNLANIRGLVVAEAIDLEIQLAHIAHQYFSTVDKEREKAKIARAENILTKKISFAAKNLARVKKIKHERIETFCDEECLTAFDFLQIVSGAIADTLTHTLGLIEKETGAERRGQLNLTATKLKALAKEVARIDADVLGVRNTLAHVKEENKNGAVVLRSRSKAQKPILIDHAWCVKTRQTIRKHSKNLLMLGALI